MKFHTVAQIATTRFTVKSVRYWKTETIPAETCILYSLSLHPHMLKVKAFGVRNVLCAALFALRIDLLGLSFNLIWFSLFCEFYIAGRVEAKQKTKIETFRWCQSRAQSSSQKKIGLEFSKNGFFCNISKVQAFKVGRQVVEVPVWH